MKAFYRFKVIFTKNSLLVVKNERFCQKDNISFQTKHPFKDNYERFYETNLYLLMYISCKNFSNIHILHIRINMFIYAIYTFLHKNTKKLYLNVYYNGLT